MDALNVGNLEFTYAGQAEPVLSGVRMRVEEGAFAVLCGSTGAGKSTLLRCIKRSIAPAGKASGSIRVFGVEVVGAAGSAGTSAPTRAGVPGTGAAGAGVASAAVGAARDDADASEAAQVGFVFQDPEAQIVCDTVWREMAFGLESLGMPEAAMRRRVAEVATVFGIGDWFDAKTAELSGGQKQLVNLASVIAMRSRLLLLDEPTAQLDPVSAQRLCDMLRLLGRETGVTVLVATHSPERFADLASVAFVLENGCIRECDVSSLRVLQEGEPRYAGGATAAVGGERGVGCAAGIEHGAAAAAAPNAAREPAIRVSDAWLSYARDGGWVLRGLDLDVSEGEVVSLVGANGCGKSTLLKLIAGVLKPQRGKVANRLGGSQAYMPQDPRHLFLFDTVREELADAGMPCETSGAPNSMLDWGTDLLRRNPLDLSGGQQQRLAMAKLLLMSPRLLLLDEPAKGLDAESQLELARLLRRLSRGGVTVVMSTHDLSFASRVSDRVALLFDGQIACVEGPREFCEGNAYYRPVPNRFTAAWDALKRDDSEGPHDAGAPHSPHAASSTPDAPEPADA